MGIPKSKVRADPAFNGYGRIPDVIARIYKRVFGRNSMYGFNAFLFDMASKGLGLQNGDSIYTTGELRFLRRYLDSLREDITVVDLGARFGQYSAYVKTRYPKAKVLAFEPDPDSFKVLEDRASKIGFSATRVGVSNRAGSAELFDLNGSKSSTCYASLHKEPFGDLYLEEAPRAKSVEVITLDQLVETHNLKKIDLLKIDTEGHEYEIIQGGQKTLTRGIVDCIQFEIDEINIIRKVTVRDFMDILPQYNLFRVQANGDLLPLDYLQLKHREIYSFQNIVAKRKID